MAEESYKEYKDDPAEYNQQCFNSWKGYFSQFEARIKENLQLYENYSEDLAERKEDKSLSRSCLFIPVINPAVLSRAAYQTNTLFSVERPIKVEPMGETPKENAENIELLVKDWLYKDGFKIKYLRAQIAKETYPIIFLGVSETEEEEAELSLEDEMLQIPGVENFSVPFGMVKKWDSGKKKWRPTVSLYTQDQVFYDAKTPEWEKKTYCGTIDHLTLAQIVERKQTMGYEFEVAVLKEKGEKVSADDFQETIRSSTEAETKESAGGEIRYKVLKNYCLVTKENGKSEWRFIHSSGGCLFKDVPFPYSKFKRAPIVPFLCYPGINNVEGICTADLLKYIQHATNDAFNIVYDAGKYGNFPPLIKDSRLTITNEMEIGPGNVWDGELSDTMGGPAGDYIKQLYQITPMDQKFFAIINTLRELAEQTSGAHGDILQGSSTAPQEKATKTAIRAKGALTRLAGINIMLDVEALKELAFFLWAITLERLAVGETLELKEGTDESGNSVIRRIQIQDISGEVEFSVPHLEGLADKEIKAEKMLNFWGVINQEPFFAPINPIGLKARYNYLKELAEAMGIDNFEKIVPEEFVEEMVAMLQQPPPAVNPVEQIMSQIQGAGG